MATSPDLLQHYYSMRVQVVSWSCCYGPQRLFSGKELFNESDLFKQIACALRFSWQLLLM